MNVPLRDQPWSERTPSRTVMVGFQSLFLRGHLKHECGPGEAFALASAKSSSGIRIVVLAKSFVLNQGFQLQAHVTRAFVLTAARENEMRPVLRGTPDDIAAPKQRLGSDFPTIERVE